MQGREGAALIEADFALFNVGQLVTVEPGCHPAAEGQLGVVQRAALAAQGSRIVWVGLMDELRDAVRLAPDSTVLNTHGRAVLPGFVDPHTHPVFAGDRSRDFYARLAGESYSEQVEAGGLMQTVRATREADEEALLGLAFTRAETFLQYGTTCIGAKTGYGLSRTDELKSLRVLNRLQRLHPVKVVPQFLGAHVVPTDYAADADGYVNEIVEEWLPAVRGLTEWVDVWCDAEAFTPEQCRRIMESARAQSFLLTAHANELGPGDGVRLAAELGARSVDHAVYLDDADIAALRDAATTAVLLPGTSFFLGSRQYAPARRLLEAGVPVAIGTDFNPGTSYSQSMQFMLTLAVLELRMTPEQAVAAATLHGARALALDGVVGSLAPGKSCDFSVFSVGDYRTIPYFYAMNLVESVVVGGKVVIQEGRRVEGLPQLAPAG